MRNALASRLRRRPTQRQLPFVAAVAATTWYFRDIARHNLPGDEYDGRWTVAVHEHWFQVFRHGRAVRDVGFYFPVHKSLGMSDAFLGQSIIHAIARELGAGAVRAWFIAQVCTYLIGAIGVAVLSRRLFGSISSQSVFVLGTCLSYPLVIQQGHVQLFAMLWLSWIAVAVIDLCRTDQPAAWAAPLLLLAPPVLALSSWYPFALGAVYALFFVATLVTLTGRAGIAALRLGIGRLVSSVRRPAGMVSAATAIALWGMAAWIYLPARDVLPARKWAEVALYSPRFSDLINAADRGGGLWGFFYRQLYPRPGMFNGEQPLGVTPLLMLFAFAAGFTLLRALLRNGDPIEPDSTRGRRPLEFRMLAFIAFVAVLATWATIIVDDQQHSLWKLFYTYVPAMDSIRAPFRIQILLYPVLLFVVLIAIESLFRPHQHDPGSRRERRLPAFGSIVVLGVGALLLAEMYRPPFCRWTSHDLLPEPLQAQMETVRSECPVFALAYEGGLESRGTGPGSIDAVILSMLVDVPTINGHSTASPVGHAAAASPTMLAPETVAWLRAQRYHRDVCIVSASGVVTVTVG